MRPLIFFLLIPSSSPHAQNFIDFYFFPVSFDSTEQHGRLNKVQIDAGNAVGGQLIHSWTTGYNINVKGFLFSLKFVSLSAFVQKNRGPYFFDDDDDYYYYYSLHRDQRTEQ
jgi:hypothetical protein